MADTTLLNPAADAGISPDLLKDAPHSTPCPACSAPIETGDSFCPNCGARVAESPAAGPAPDLTVFKCKNCSAEVRCEPGLRTANCPFCAAPYVIEATQSATGKRQPEFVLGFEIDQERAERIYREWIGKRALFRPSDLKHLAQSDGLRGIYLPFWSFTMKADSRWSAQIGEYWYRTETYVTRDANGRETTQTRQVRETEWWPLEGGHHAFYSFFPVSASHGLPHEVSRWVEPFQLAGLKRFSARYLSGWAAEDYSVEQDEARLISQQEFRERERQAIAAFLPGDTWSNLNVHTDLNEIDSDLILLPIYLRSYRFRGKLFRTLINGQTGKIAGEKPISYARIALFVLAILLFVAGVVLVARARS